MDDDQLGRAEGRADDDRDAPPEGGTGAPDPLLSLRAALDEVDDLPLAARADVFERAHGVVVEELRALELG